MLKLLVILTFSFCLFAKGLIPVEDNLEKFHNNFSSFQILFKTNQNHIYSKSQRNEILSLAIELLHQGEVIDDNNELIKLVRVKRFNEKSYSKVLNNLNTLIYSSELFLNVLIAGTPMVAVLSEDSQQHRYKGEVFKGLIKNVLNNAKTGKNHNYTSKHHRLRDNLTILDLSELSIGEMMKAFKISNKKALELSEAASLFMENISRILTLKVDADLDVGKYTIMYDLKVLLLKAASYVSLPVKHNIDYRDLRDIHSKSLLPGDIGVIQRFYKLSNYVFNGNWTHSLLYIGRYSQLRDFVSSDDETNEFYKMKCSDEKIQCHDFLSFMELSYPKSFTRYMNSDNDDNPIVSIEALKPGVILNTIKESIAWDNLAMFRPNLSVRDRAIAIEKAFSIIGLEYDYNFNGYTFDKLVCTEVIKYIYEEDTTIGKMGLDWKMQNVLGSPVMYAFDIVKTYFSELNTNESNLKFIMFLKSSKGDTSYTRASTQELINTL